MDKFKIGDMVEVSAIVKPEYTLEGRRVWSRCKPSKSTAWYVGYSFKQEGLVNFSNKITGPGLLDIKVLKTMRIKFSDHGNDYFALRQDITKINGKEVNSNRQGTQKP